MMKKLIIKSTQNMNTGSISWKMITRSYHLIHNIVHQSKNLIHSNKELKDVCIGKRCFILGNGPSIKIMNLVDLLGQDIFTVNMMIKHPDFNKIKSKYHVFADDEFFRESNVEFQEIVANVINRDDMTVFVPVSAEKHINRLKTIKMNADIRYFFPWNSYKHITDIDISKCMPAFNKVIHYAIAFAIYMGYSEIYLIGCEETGILTYINLAMTGDTQDDHFYITNCETKKIWKEQLNERGLAWEFEQEAQVLNGYKELAQYCQSKNIIIENLTPKTLIDSIKRNSWENVWKEVIRY